MNMREDAWPVGAQVTKVSGYPFPAGVNVKPLEWSTGWGTIKAETPIGHYFIDDNRDGGFKVRLEDTWSSWASNSEAAKAAAQADYERRVLSALEPTPIRETAEPADVGDEQGVTDEAIRWTDRNGHHYRMDHGAILNDYSTGAWVRYADYQRLAAENERLRGERKLTLARVDEMQRHNSKMAEEWAELTRSREAAESKLAEAVKVLGRIERWEGEFPATGEYWPNTDGGLSDRPMSYGACYGSNGERDYMRGLARTFLASLPL